MQLASVASDHRARRRSPRSQHEEPPVTERMPANAASTAAGRRAAGRRLVRRIRPTRCSADDRRRRRRWTRPVPTTIHPSAARFVAPPCTITCSQYRETTTSRPAVACGERYGNPCARPRIADRHRRRKNS